MTCDERFEQLSALLDGELAASDIAQLTRHLASCPACARHLAELGGLRAALAEGVPEQNMSADFLARIDKTLDDAARDTADARVIPFRPRLRRADFVSLALGVAVAAMLAIAFLPHGKPINDLMAVRDAALRGAVVSASSSGIEAPAVAGFRLAGAREDVVAGHQARVLIYTAGNDRSVTLCIWKANGEPAHGVRQGAYRGMAIRYWNDGINEYWAASTAADTLGRFVTAAGGDRV